MVDAFGAYGYNGEYELGLTYCDPAGLHYFMLPVLTCLFLIGPFRRTCEITLRLLRQNEDALMTILETFLHDPTTDFIGKRVSFQTPTLPRDYKCLEED